MGLDRRNADRTALNSPIAAFENGLCDRVRDLEVKNYAIANPTREAEKKIWNMSKEFREEQIFFRYFKG